MNPSPRARRNAHEQGIALVLTLAILALVTLLVIGFLTSARVENMAARNFNDGIRAQQLARAALDEAVTVLRTSTPIVDSSHFYVTRPGQAGLKQSGGSYTNQLYSYPASGPLQTTNVNQQHAYSLIQHGRYLIAANPTGISALKTLNNRIWSETGDVFLPWVFIGTNGQEVAYGSEPIVGRYVWYVDDEACKINLNSAGMTDTNATLGGPVTPAQVDIRGLFNPFQWSITPIPGGITITNILGKITNYAARVGFTTPTEWHVAVNVPPTVPPTSDATNAPYYYIDFNPDEMTVWSVDPNITPWGADRLNLNTVGTGAVAVASIANMLGSAQLAGWFGVGKTFATKYPSVQQIAANIVDFIDTDPYPTDLTPAWVPATWDDENVPGCLGLEKWPYLNELVISNIIVVATNSTGSATVTVTNNINVECRYLSGGTWTNPANTEVFLKNFPSITFSVSSGSIAPAALTLPDNTASTTKTIPVAAGSGTNSYPVSSIPLRELGIATTTTNIGTLTVTLNPGVITAILRVNGQYRIDYAQIPVTNYTLANIPLNGNVTTNITWVTACNDPRVKPYSNIVDNNWNPVTIATPGTLGQGNSGTVYYTKSNMWNGVSIISDGDDSSHITTNRDNGTLYSVGELGYIHTGVPWRTLRLQPIPAAEANTIPDWAVLDLFSTVSGSVTGRVNLNSKHAAQTVDPTVGHNLALRGALFAHTNLVVVGTVTNDYAKIASNIVTTTWSTNDWSSSTAHGNFVPGMYNWIGEVCEVKGVADYAKNASNVTTNDAWAEMRIRRLANLVTTRSTAFKVIVLAQTIVDANRDGQYNSADGDIISGEVRLSAIVERYEQSGKSEPGYRIKQFRQLSD